MEFGLHLPQIGPLATRDGLLEMARAADAAGIDSLWASDHVIVPRDYASAYPYSPSGKMPIAPPPPSTSNMCANAASFAEARSAAGRTLAASTGWVRGFPS